MRHLRVLLFMCSVWGCGSSQASPAVGSTTNAAVEAPAVAVDETPSDVTAPSAEEPSPTQAYEAKLAQIAQAHLSFRHDCALVVTELNALPENLLAGDPPPPSTGEAGEAVHQTMALIRDGAMACKAAEGYPEAHARLTGRGLPAVVELEPLPTPAPRRRRR